ncbi:MAG: hypothetical protein K8S25_04015 [Alphaproteobacteria bacterium]|nr:hypothetical protein [Alphaproteobacteria bacterium]
MSEGQTNTPPSLRKLLLVTIGAGVAATVLTVLVVLPAEFGRDPTGFGRLTGLDQLAPAHEHVVEMAAGPGAPAMSQDAPFRSDVVEVPLVPKGDKTGRYELEYKVRMTTGQAIVYSWEAQGAGEGEFFSDLHAETAPDPEVRVIEFKQETALRSNGSLVAPVDGVHGWYWRNNSPNKVTVRLKLSGFYELIPPGETGNKAGIVPVAASSP